ncbi:MAG: PilT/PilU family type 4a pilus ATPase, partial [Gammaproteobacteria bacterium]|nr:PilT/PilU family type 4a pilus ATPase [Gammaproteobacteria bacterium]
SILTPEQQEKFQTDLIEEISLSFPDIGSFRGSLFHQCHGMAAVFRVIPSRIPSLTELSLPPIIKSLLGLSHGLILVTGPTGSGKSTTLAAMINYLNTFHSYHIITIEDPIEFLHSSKKSIVNQLQVGRDTPSFSTALRASLRQDPDVILLGELRDFDTMRLALTAAETGHLVFATLHASSAPLAINRFVDACPLEENTVVRNMLSESLQAVICQTLVKTVTRGRVAAFEIMLSTPAIRHYIRRDMPGHMESTIQTSGDKGMCTLTQYLNELIEKRIITPLTAETTITSRGSFKEFDEKQLKK